MARHIEGELGIKTPTILHQGEIAGWRYLVMTRVPGRPLGVIWHEIGQENRQAIAHQAGQLIARLHSLSVQGLEELAVDWPAFVKQQVATAAERHHNGEVPQPLIAQIPAFVKSTSAQLIDCPEPVLLLADITTEHLLLFNDGGSWQIVGYVDFGDAFVGHPEYELVAPGLEIARGDARLLRALLLSAGYSESELNWALSRRLMAFTLLHRFVKLADILNIVPQARGITDLEHLTRILWPVC
jgi:hygromycin-B 7''-O-kinase